MVAFFPPALAVTVTVLPFPAFFAVNTPLELILAYFFLLTDQVTFLSVAFVGLIVAFIVSFFPALTDFLALSEIFFTGILAIFNWKVANLPLPSAALTVIVTVLPAPAGFAVTFPFLSTVA